MRSRQIRYGLLGAAVLLLVAAGAMGTMLRPPIEADTVVSARFGDVIWNHELHARMPEIATCQVCHHTARLGDTQPKPCGHCHKEQTNDAAVILSDLQNLDPLYRIIAFILLGIVLLAGAFVYIKFESRLSESQDTSKEPQGKGSSHDDTTA